MTRQVGNHDLASPAQLGNQPFELRRAQRRRQDAALLSLAAGTRQLAHIETEPGCRARAPERLAHLVVAPAARHGPAETRRIGREHHPAVITITAQLPQIELDFAGEIARGGRQAPQVPQCAADFRKPGQPSSRFTQHRLVAIQLRKELERHAIRRFHIAQQRAQLGKILGLQRVEQFLLAPAFQTAAAHEAAQHADVAEIDLRGDDSGLRQRREHEPLHLDVAFETTVAEKLRTDLHRFACAAAGHRQRVYDAARVTQPRHALAIEQVRIDTRRLRCDIGAQPQHAAVELIHQLEGLQVQVAAGTGEERIQIFDHRRDDQLIAVGDQQIEHAPAQPFDAHRLGGQRIFDVFGQYPTRGQRSLRHCEGAGAFRPAQVRSAARRPYLTR